MADLVRPEHITDVQFAEMVAAAEKDERLQIWYSTVFMAQGLIEAAELTKQLREYGDERVEKIASDIFNVCLAHLAPMTPAND